MAEVPSESTYVDVEGSVDEQVHGLGGGSPWPRGVDGLILFLADVKDPLDLRILRARLLDTLPEGRSREEGVDWEVVSIGATDRVGYGELASRLLSTQDMDPWLQPLRLIWMGNTQSSGSGLLRGLNAARAENPAQKRRRRLLRTQPERIRLLSGQGASYSTLRGIAQDVWTDKHGRIDLAAFARRQAIIVLDREERNARGARYKIPRLIPEDVFANEQYRAKIWKLAQQTDRDPEELLQEAEGYLAEMGTTQTPFSIDLLQAIFRAMYTASHEREIDVVEEQMARIEELIKTVPVAFVMTHKSMLDAIALQVELYERNLPMPLTFGGANLDTFGIGYLARRAGTIFLRRSFQDNEIYKATFKRYIDYLIEKRFSVLWALEGTRSRTGKLLPPRYGMFNYIVEGILRTRSFDMAFVPVHIAFDQVPEVQDYAIEQMGKDKKAEGAGWFVRFMKPNQPHGKIFLRFGEPVRLGDIVEPEALNAGLPPGERQGLVQKLAFECAVRMNNAAPITPAAVITLILLAGGDRAQRLSDLQYQARAGMAIVRKRKLEVVGDRDFKDPERVKAALEQLHGTGIVTYYDDGEERLYGIAPEQRMNAAYYRNGVIHYFITDAMLEVALLKAAGKSEDVFWVEMEALRDLFKHEFYWRQRGPWQEITESRLAMRFRNWREVLPQGEAAVREMFDPVRPLFAHALLRAFVDAYGIVARRLARLRGGAIGDRKQLVTECLALGRQLCHEGRVFSEESVSRSLFDTALKVVDSRGLALASPDVHERRVALLEELQDITVQLDEILDMTLKRTLNQEF